MAQQKRTYKKYAKISVKKRQSLLRMVCQEGVTQRCAADKLKIKLQTAKLIIRKFKQTGTIFQKKMPYNRRNFTGKVQVPTNIQQEVQLQVFGREIENAQNQRERQQFRSENHPEFEPSFSLVYYYFPFSGTLGNWEYFGSL